MTGDAILGLLGEVRKDSLKWRPRPTVILSALVSASKRFLRCTWNSLYASSNKRIFLKICL